MKRSLSIGVAVAALALLVFVLGAGAQAAPPKAQTGAATTPAKSAKPRATPAQATQPRGPRLDPGRVKRGAYLVNASGCNDCHTPLKFEESLGMPVPDRSRMLSGHPEGAPDPRGQLGQGDQAIFGPTFTAVTLPFGTVYAPNLTPHKTGLGDWSEEMFVQAMRTGRHLGAPNGRPILPPMPWPNLAGLTDEDLRSIWAYLQSVPPVANAVPAPKVPQEALQKIQAAYDKMRPLLQEHAKH